MYVLEYNNLDYSGLETKYQKIRSALEAEDYYTAQVKKLRNGYNQSLYAARLDHTNRILFKFAKYKAQKYILILEIIRNHDYDGAKFLNGAKVIEEKTPLVEKSNSSSGTNSAESLSSSLIADATAEDVYEADIEDLKYINAKEQKFYFLDKLISFDESQSLVYSHSLPIVIIGSAGSGKTVLSLEKMKKLHGHILYISQSNYLVDNAKNLYFSHRYNNDHQEIDFLSYNEFLETIRAFDNNSKICSYSMFKGWHDRHKNLLRQYKVSNPSTGTSFSTNAINDPEKIFEEIKGTITGIGREGAYLTKEQYLDLGVRQSLFLQEEKEPIYLLFQKYLEWIREQSLIDINLLSYEYLKLVESKYDYVVIDEIQDLTTVQIELILSSLKSRKYNFLFCGDSNQIVHPNFFSWAKIKSLLYKDTVALDKDILFLLTTNYRNSKSVTDIANKVLKIKQQRFGSIDKESNYLVESVDSKDADAQSTTDTQDQAATKATKSSNRTTKSENSSDGTTRSGTSSRTSGEISFIKNKDKRLEKLNTASKKSTKFAIVVLKEEDKKEAAKYFDNPLIFSIHEAKGLEYENIILYNIISNAHDKFEDIAENITIADLDKDLSYSRAKDKTDKSLESYKFYINAFYVGITRAIKNLYVIEDRTNNNFLNLLDIYSYERKEDDDSDIKAEESSLDEWQREASKLEKQGKQEQADKIRSTIAKPLEITWDILTDETIAVLEHKLKLSLGIRSPAIYDENARENNAETEMDPTNTIRTCSDVVCDNKNGVDKTSAVEVGTTSSDHVTNHRQNSNNNNLSSNSTSADDDGIPITKKEKILLFEYAFMNNRQDLITLLEKDGLTATKNLAKSFKIIKDKYYVDYLNKDPSAALDRVRKYGLNAKDKFGLTPLEIAIKVGNADIAEKIIDYGASTNTYDKNGLLPIQNYLSYLFYLEQYTKEDYIIKLYELLSKESLVIKVKDRLYKIDNHRSEYFLFHYMVGCFINYHLKNQKKIFRGFTAADLRTELSWIPNQILAPYQKQREYISSILSKHNWQSNNSYAKYLFQRLKVGHYIINPDVEVRHNGSWIKLYYLFPLEVREDKIVPNSVHKVFVNLVKDRRVMDSLAIASAQMGEAKDKLLKSVEKFASVYQGILDK
jgi:hypothetical protein